MSDRALIAQDIEAYLERHARKDLLRFITAGSVDDGKSTLIGRMLHDAQLVHADQLETLRRESGPDGIDFALLVDGLGAEREQRITIDVAYRYFATDSRKFILADSPGHEQYTRNMVTAASTANLAIILVDARHGVVDQTRRHSFLATLLGIQHVVVAINKMDLVEYAQETFETIRSDYTAFAAKLDVRDLHFIPVSALRGDNVVQRSTNMPWYGGSALLHYLESVHIASDVNLIDLRFPVQYVIRPDDGFRGYAGTVSSGTIRPGDEVIAFPSERRTRIHAITTHDGERDSATAGDAITVTLADDIDVSRGSVLAAAGNLPTVSDGFDAMLIWMDEQPLETDRSYLLKHATTEVQAVVATVRYRMDVNHLHRVDSDELKLNEIGRVQLSTARPLAFDSYERNRAHGSFVLIDRLTNATVAAGVIVARRASDEERTPRALLSELSARKSQVSRAEREQRAGHKAFALWFTGLPRSGKSSIAYELERRIFDRGLNAYVLDGTNLRLGLSNDLSFGGLDRSEHMRRAAEIVKLTCNLGVITIAAFVSPFAADRFAAREAIGRERFVEVFCRASLATCEGRDESGLYARARAGEIKNFTGIDAPYEPPESPALVLDTENHNLEQSVATVIEMLETEGWLAR